MSDLTPEQIALQDKLAKMSPEELKEWQKQRCVFCHIISGKQPAKKVYEDSKCYAVLDINPANPGHILLMTREHYSIMPQVPENELSHLFMVAKALSNALLKAMQVNGTNIIVQNGPAAGQKSQHFMVHIIPRKEGDNVGLGVPQKEIRDTDLEQIKTRLKKRVNEIFGINEDREERYEAEGISSVPARAQAPATSTRMQKLVDTELEDESSLPEIFSAPELPEMPEMPVLPEGIMPADDAGQIDETEEPARIIGDAKDPDALLAEIEAELRGDVERLDQVKKSAKKESKDDDADDDADDDVDDDADDDVDDDTDDDVDDDANTKGSSKGSKPADTKSKSSQKADLDKISSLFG